MHDRLDLLARIALGVLLVVGIAFTAVMIVPGSLGAESSFVVLSGSMQPTLQPGDAVVVRSVEPGGVHEGDIVTFRADDSRWETGSNRVTHRVVEVVDTEHGVAYRTQGDANDRPDRELVDHSQLVGEVWFHVPYLGRFFLFVQRPVGQFLLVILPGLLLVASGLRTLLGSRETGGTTASGDGS